LADDAQSLVIFLDSGLNFSNIFLVGGNAVTALLCNSVERDEESTRHCRRQKKKAHFQNLRDGSR